MPRVNLTMDEAAALVHALALVTPAEGLLEDMAPCGFHELPAARMKIKAAIAESERQGRQMAGSTHTSALVRGGPVIAFPRG